MTDETTLNDSQIIRDFENQIYYANYHFSDEKWQRLMDILSYIQTIDIPKEIKINPIKKLLDNIYYDKKNVSINVSANYKLSPEEWENLTVILNWAEKNYKREDK